MGINREFAALLVELRRRGALGAVASVVELGAQEISAEPSAIGRILNEARIGAGEPIATARALYESFGCTRYCAIDASGGADVLTFDLNRDLARDHDFHETFDLVTNLGTLEHCFNQAAGFENMHRLCRPGGLMIHCLPTQGLVNHGFYNYHPRFVADLASANGYDILDLFVTADFTPQRIPYSIANFRAIDGRDLMLYAVLRRNDDAPFRTPFDGMFAAENRVGYAAGPGQADVLAGEFQPYIKASWENIIT